MTQLLNRVSFVVLAFLVCLVTGCGGAKKAAAPVAQGNAAPPSPDVPPGATNGEPAADKGKSKAGANGNTTESEPPTGDDFVLSTDQIALEIEDPKPAPRPVLFEITSLPNGISSTNMIIVDRPANAGTAAYSEYPMQVATNPMQTATFPATGQPRTPNVANPDRTPPATTNSSGSDEWALPKGFSPVAGTANDPETGLPLRIHSEHDPVEMALIPPGVFLRGADVSDPTVSPRHTVLMEQPYYIDVVEVTVERYDAFREFFRKSEGRKFDAPVNHDGHPLFPAVGVKFFDAKFYAKWTGKELPTETQWERAARGDEGHPYPWGDGRAIFHLPRTPGQLDPVGIYPGDRSPFGVMDMAGNAREFCLDLYQADVYQKEMTLGAGTVRNPVGPKSASGAKQQVVRGSRTDWAVWHRSAIPQLETAQDIGFRCVLNVTATTKSKTTKSDKPEKGGPKKPDEKTKPGDKAKPGLKF